MTDLRKAAEMALEALDCEPESFVSWTDRLREAREALRQALAQSEQEPIVHPVVHLWDCICNWAEMIANDGKDANLSPPDWLVDAVKLATAPPKCEWVGLNHFDRTLLRTTFATLKPLYHDEAKNHSVCAEVVDWDALFASTEAKLKEKNGF